MTSKPGERLEASLTLDLESSIADVFKQTLSLCDYLQELRKGKYFKGPYTQERAIYSINKVASKINAFPVNLPLACGTTINNKHQFEWLLMQLRRINPGQILANISLAPWSGIIQDVGISEKTKKNVAQIICEYIQNADTSPYHSDFLFKYALNFVRFYLSFGSTFVERCPFACVSNDHTPINMAFAKAAKSHGLYTIYLQHAFVTKLFPALDFDLSILFNRETAEIYGASSEIGKSLLIIPRYPVQPAEEKSLSYKEEIKSRKKKIVIYLGGSNDIVTIIKAMDTLSANPLVENVFVKFHPNPINHDLKEVLERVYSPDHVGVGDINYPHLAICGNSSVVMKLIASGVRCFHLFDLDTRRRDYYGFSSGGIAPELTIPELAYDFWAGWNEKKYVTSRSKYIEDPISNQVEEHLCLLDGILRERLAQSGGKVFSNAQDICAKGKPDASPDHSLFLNRDEVAYVNALLLCSRPTFPFPNEIIEVDLGKLNPHEKVVLLIRCYRFRHPRALELMLAAAKNDTSRWVRVFFKYHSGYIVGIEGLEEGCNSDLDFIYSDECELRSPEMVCSEVLRYLTTVGWQEVVSALNHLNKYPVNSGLIPIRTWDKIFSMIPLDKRRLIESNPLCSPVLIKFKKSAEDATNASSHSELVRMYLSSKSGSFKKPLASIFANIENRVRDNRVVDLRMARTDHSRVERFWELVIVALSSGIGFSLIRLGDGEGYIYSSEIFSDDDCKNRERHWWGCELHEFHRSRLQRQLLSAVTRCDVIGLPSIFRFMRDFRKPLLPKESFYKSVQARGLLEVLNGFNQYQHQAIAIVEDRANDYLFANLRTRLAGLSHLISKIVLVSSLPDQVSQREFSEFGKFVSIRVPTRARTFWQPGRSQQDAPTLPYLYNDTIELIRRHSGPGVLLIVAAGVIGKIFLDIGKQCGAVALDIGEVAEQL
jgi:hypothetical protein